MRSPRPLAVIAAIVASATTSIAACGGGNDGPTTPTTVAVAPAPAPTPTPAPSTLDVCAAIGSAPAFAIISGESCGVSGSSVVQVILRDVNDGGGGLCTGTVIAQNAVLTAAHCVIAGVEAVSVVAAGRTVSVASNHPVASYSEEDEGSLDVGGTRLGKSVARAF